MTRRNQSGAQIDSAQYQKQRHDDLKAAGFRLGYRTGPQQRNGGGLVTKIRPNLVTAPGLATA